MSEIRRRYDPEFKSGAVRIVLETGKPIAQVARDLGSELLCQNRGWFWWLEVGPDAV